MAWEDFIIKLALGCFGAVCLYHFISGAIESGNRELVYAIKESTRKICDELEKVRKSNEKN